MTRPHVAFALILLSQTAFADQRVLVDSLLPTDFQPVAFTPWTADGFWALGTAGTLATLVRYNASGSVRFMRYPFMPNSPPNHMQLAALPDGGVISTDFEDASGLGNQACKMRRYDAAGNQLWTSDLAQPTGWGVGYPSCSNVYIDGADGIWLFPGGVDNAYIVSVNANGSQGPETSLSDQYAAQAAADPANAGIFIAGALGRPDIDPTTTRATIWRLTTQGIQWTASAPPSDAGSRLSSIVVAEDGSLWGFGSKGAQLYGMHVDGFGGLLWSGSFDTAVSPSQIALVSRTDGGVASMHWDPSAFYGPTPGALPELSTFSSTGTRLWHQPAGFSFPGNSSIGPFNLAAASNGDLSATVSYLSTASSQSQLQQLRVDGNGAPLFTTSVQNVPINTNRLQMLSDDSSLTVAGSFQHLSRTGSVLTAPDTTAITTAASLDMNALLAPDGSSYLVVTNQSDKTVGLLAYSNTGSLRWHVAVPGGSSEYSVGDVWVLLRQSDVCIAGDLYGNEVVECFALADGTPSAQIVLVSGLSQYGALTQAIVTSGNQIVVLYQRGDNQVMHHALIDANSNLVHDITPLQAGEVWSASVQNVQGNTVLRPTSNTLLELAVDGSRAHSVPIDIPVRDIALAPDGRAILVANASPLVLEGIDPNGNRMWQTTMPIGDWNTVRSFRYAGDDIYFALIRSDQTSYSGGNPLLNGAVAKLSLSTGALAWSSALPYVRGYWPRLVLDPNHNQVISFAGWGDRTQLRRYSISDGTPLGSKFETCAVDQCLLYQAILATDGTLRMVHDTTDYVSGSAFELTTLQNIFDTIFADGFGF